MKNSGRAIQLAVMLGIGVFASAASDVTQTANGYVLKVGQPFPDLVLPALEDGSPLSLATFRGQKVILHVWASW